MVPTHSAINLKKSDKLPSRQKLLNSKERIIEWWKQAWVDPDEYHKFENVREKYAPYFVEQQYQIDISSSSLTNENLESIRFFTEANLALPGLNSKNRSVDDVFEALILQREKLREMQQLQEW